MLVFIIMLQRYHGHVEYIPFWSDQSVHDLLQMDNVTGITGISGGIQCGTSIRWDSTKFYSYTYVSRDPSSAMVGLLSTGILLRFTVEGCC